MKKKLTCLLLVLLLFTGYSTSVLAATAFTPTSSSGCAPAGSSKQYYCWLGGTTGRVVADMFYSDERNNISIQLFAYMYKPDGSIRVGYNTGTGLGSVDTFFDSLPGLPIDYASANYFVKTSCIETLYIG